MGKVFAKTEIDNGNAWRTAASDELHETTDYSGLVVNKEGNR
jgi:hypothetical protein